MSQFWPTGLDLQDTDSVLDIPQAAQREWSEQSGGLLTLVIQDAKTEGENQHYIVHAKHAPTDRTLTLFSVQHRTQLMPEYPFTPDTEISDSFYCSEE